MSEPVQTKDEVDELDSLLNEVEEQEDQSFQRLNQTNALNQADLVQPPVDDGADFDNFNPNEFESHIQVFDLLRQNNCVHEVAVPKCIQYTRDDTEKPTVKTFDFTLDAFQSEAIDCLNNEQSVLVSAHTSAGKTVVALYAVALALGKNQRVIYTTPIKALSNQKYRELLEEFGDVGLMTGDVTLNPEASCLVMTTEILRSMLYRGSEIMREVGWVIFDEIHYMRDAERGVVWEETIILLPDNVHYVFLSATIPNAKQFATWIANLHNQVCHIVYTDYRPTPLQHVFYSSGSNGLYEVVNSQGEFREEQFSKAMSFINDAQENSKEARNQAMQKTGNNVTLLIRTVQERELLPCIVFSFSRKECEAYASGLKEMDFNDNANKNMVKEIFENAVSLLSEEDQKLPQIKWILPFLLRGVGIHHSGLLPLLKECIEILFGEGLLKILFATETFAMGLNMPARTVLFTSARKFDGRENRWMSSGEYIQMSGRAGRRGLDSQGLVILMVDQKMSADVAKNIIKGHTDPLNSQFRLTYNMVLNLTRVPEINPQYMMERSFRYFQNKSLLPPLYEKWQAKKKELEECAVDSEEQLQQYYQLKIVACEVKKRINQVVLQPKNLGPFLKTGRLIRIRTTEADLGWGVLLDTKKKVNKLGDTVIVLEMLLRLSWDCVKDLNNVEKLRSPEPNQSAAPKIIPVDIQCVTALSSVLVKVPPDERDQNRLKDALGKLLEKALNKFSNALPELDPINDMGIKDKSLQDDLEYLKKLEKEIAIHPIKDQEGFDVLYAKYERKLQIQEELKLAREELKTIKAGQFNEELLCRQKVLRKMGYIDTYGTITKKGRIACEISAADEILLTEMLLTGVFSEMSSADAAALLSCFVFEEKTDKMPKLDDKLQQAFNSLVTHARKVAKASIECGMDLIEEKYIEKLQNGIMPVVKQWCSGASFKQISEDSGIFEGSIIRCLRRLEELLREMVSAVKAMGDTTLSASFEEASKNLKRDIVFAASLYL